MHTDIKALSGIRTNDPSVPKGEDGSCLRPRGHCDGRKRRIGLVKFKPLLASLFIVRKGYLYPAELGTTRANKDSFSYTVTVLCSTERRKARQCQWHAYFFHLFPFLRGKHITEPAADNTSSTDRPQIDCLIRPVPQVMRHAYVASAAQEVAQHPFMTKPRHTVSRFPLTRNLIEHSKLLLEKRMN
jgi:hypothetical protein